MTGPGVPAPGRGAPLEVVSTDGTPLAVWVDGHGPPLVLVHGSMTDHTGFAALVARLRDGLTTFSMDRRGHGASGDADGYTIDREFEDVAAVVDAVAARTSGPVALLGHSFGAGCAMGGAARTGNVHRLVLYEPGLGRDPSVDAVERVEVAVAAGDLERGFLAVLDAIGGATEEDVEVVRSASSWAQWVAAAPVALRELRAEGDWVYRPGQFDAVVSPTLVLAGSESPPTRNRATIRSVAAIAGTSLRVLGGQGHFAFMRAPEVVASVVRRFVVTRRA